MIRDTVVEHGVQEGVWQLVFVDGVEQGGVGIVVDGEQQGHRAVAMVVGSGQMFGIRAVYGEGVACEGESGSIADGCS